MEKFHGSCIGSSLRLPPQLMGGPPWNLLALRDKVLEILQNIPECKPGEYYSLENALELRFGK